MLHIHKMLKQNNYIILDSTQNLPTGTVKFHNYKYLINLITILKIK